MGIASDWLEGRRVARSRETRGSGLYWVDERGRVHALGRATRDDLATLSWAWRIAYRATHRRDERSRLARGRDFASRLGKAVAALPSSDER